MATITAIQGVDDTLRAISKKALGGIDPPVDVTVGPLDRDENQTRLNWFLYRVTPNAAFANMEPPGTGWRTARGRPPLALALHYLLTAHPGHLSLGGEEDQFSHKALTAVMQALHDNAIITEAETDVLSPLARPLVEPLRVTMESLDLEAISKIWTASSKPLRLSVGYGVSLVVVDATAAHVAGPPVKERRVAVAPSMGPRVRAVSPNRISAGAPFTVTADGLASTATFRLASRAGDPPTTASGWPLSVVAVGRGVATVSFAERGLVPGERRLDVVVTDSGLVVGSDAAGVTVVPLVISHSATTATGAAVPAGGPVPAGGTVTFEVAHGGADVEVFLGGRRMDAATVQFLAKTNQVKVVVPKGTKPGPLEASLRAGKAAGPPYGALVVGP